jgi:GT2 family glycosyltransferase
MAKLRRGAGPELGLKVQAARQIVGFLDRIDEAGVGGWALDVRQPGERLRLRVLIDEVIVDVVTCDMQREDAAALKLPSNRIGFYYNIPARYQDGMRHKLHFAALDGVPVTMASRNSPALEALHFCLAKPVRIEGAMDGLVDGLIQGWALHVDDRAKTKLGGVRILVMAGGQPLAELLADQYRADVAAALGCEASCGFTFAPPPEWRNRKRTAFRFFALPGRQELSGSPIEVAYPEAGERERLEALIARTDELFTLAYHLRRELKGALPGERYLLSDYPRWAAKSLPQALPRAVARYGELPVERPLVSIICPVFRPVMGEFLAAIDSVRAQTYPNWELLLVDDASQDAKLSAVMRQLCEGDARIKLKILPEKGGISQASNAALGEAAGAFVAFFDHDDLLEPVALEIMLRAQAATGAKLLYSDEDKVERSGGFCEPHFKPDFNYRFLLDLNYICHFVMVEAQVLRQAGGLDKRFDGAQDHDLLLRLSELLSREQIHHVQEILYHWRKTGDSTAAAGTAAKPRAAQAGEAAVASHLKRRKLPADVVSRGGLTCYQVRWRPPPASKQGTGVSILIPFRDHVDMTAECVAAIRKYTKDVGYEIILLDNWSVTPEAQLFTAAQANLAETRVLRIAEPFNFSRINNIGARAARHGFLLFLNNDVIVSDPDWLRFMLDECVVNPQVGAVGAKLLYPGGAVQHGGVVLGVGGVADHAFRGIARTAPGYVMRAMAAQQISAVTAACMLVRRSAFQQVGGFDEAELTVAFNDVDLCVKLSGAGWEIIYMPDAIAEHRESVSRGDDFDEAKIARFMFENEVMRQRHAAVLPYDPFYSRHFSREGGVYRELRVLGPDDR